MKKKKAKKRRSAKKVIKNKSAQKKTSKKKKVAKVKAMRRRHPTEEEYKQLGKEKRRAREYVTDKPKTAQLLEEAMEKAKRNKGALTKLWGKLMVLFRLVSAWVKGEYTDVPLKTILLAIAAIIYFLNPFDVIPDFIPGLGYVDDVSVIAYAINSIRGDLDKFLEWERSKK